MPHINSKADAVEKSIKNKSLLSAPSQNAVAIANKGNLVVMPIYPLKGLDDSVRESLIKTPGAIEKEVVKTSKYFKINGFERVENTHLLVRYANEQSM